MKTITFYSYKGGVGRSLALSNIATRLSEIGKRVCIMDFDLDAPGLQFKFPDYRPSGEIREGLVDYIYSHAVDKNDTGSVGDFSIVFEPLNADAQPITFIPAGDIRSVNYWKKLSMIPWSQLFYSEDGDGIEFFLDLKARIEKEFKPDFLLIDSRTGITDISAITLKIFADEAVVLAAYNEENIFGSKMILKNLFNPAQSLFGTPPKVTFLLTRLPFTDSADDNEKKFAIQEKVRSEIMQELAVDHFEVLLIHSNSSLEIQEKKLMGYEYEKGISISNDYLKLFDLLTIGVLDSTELLKFQQVRAAVKEYAKGQQERDKLIKLKHYDKAIELDGRNGKYFVARAYLNSTIENWDEAIRDYKKAAELTDLSGELAINIGHCYYKKENYPIALNYFDQSPYLEATVYKVLVYEALGNKEQAMNLVNFVLDKDPDHHEALNARANMYRESGDFDLALKDIYRALELSPQNAVYFATLAEIRASQNKPDEFYLNLSVAFSFGLKISNIISEKGIYLKYIGDEKLRSLFKIHNLDPEDLKQLQ